MELDLLVFICWSLHAHASVGVHFPAWLAQAVSITRGCVPCAFICFICWWGQCCCWNIGVNVLKQMFLHPSVRRPFAALIAYFSLSASTSPMQVFVSILFLLPHPIMKHDLIVLDTNRIQEDCSPSFCQHEGDRTEVMVERKGFGSWKTTAEEEIAVRPCRAWERTLDSPSLLLPERLITEAGRGKSW